MEVCASLVLSEVSEETSDPSDLELSNGPRPPLNAVPVSDLTNSLSNSKTTATNCQPPQPTTTNQLPGNQDREAETCSPSTTKQQEYGQSWEVLSRLSTTSTLLTMRQDTASPKQQLIPLWECLQVNVGLYTRCPVSSLCHCMSLVLLYVYTSVTTIHKSTPIPPMCKNLSDIACKIFLEFYMCCCRKENFVVKSYMCDYLRRCNYRSNLFSSYHSLQEAFKTPMVRVGSHRIKLQQVIPELLFNDFAPELLFRTTLSAPDMFLLSLEEHMNGGIPPPEDTGRYLRLYYTQENEDHTLMKTAGAEKAVSHQQTSFIVFVISVVKE